MDEIRPWERTAQSLGLSRNIIVMSLTTSIYVVAIFTWNRIMPLALRELGATDLQVSLSFAILTVATGIGQFPGGLWCDHFGRKPLVAFPTFVAAGLYLVAAMAGTWWGFVLAMAGVNLTGAIQSPAFVMVMAESVDGRKRGMAFGVFQFFIGLSMAAGPALGALLLPRLGFRELVGITGVVGLAVGIARVVFLQETVGGAEKHRRFDLRHIWRGELGILLLVSSFILWIPALTMYGPFISLYAKDVQGFSEAQINTFFAYGSLVATFVSLLGGRITERWGAGRAVVFGVAGHVVTMLLWSGTRSFAPATAVLALSYSFLQVFTIAHDTLRTSIASRYAAGAAIGALGTISNTFSGLAAPSAGYLKPALGRGFPFWLAAGFGAAAIGAVFLLTRVSAGARRGGVTGGVTAGAPRARNG